MGRHRAARRGLRVRIVRFAAPLLAGALAAIASCASVSTLAAATTAACSTTAGVTVIVDFTHFGGAIERGCDAGLPANALDALHAAGFTTEGTVQYGDAFVCRIDGKPGTQTCESTPPANASWSFYAARATDAQWTYESVGVLSYRPPPGTIVAFAFGDLARPGIPPSAAIPPPTTTTGRPVPPPTSPATSPGPGPAPAPTVAPLGGPAGPSARGPSTTGAAPGAPAATRSPSAPGAGHAHEHEHAHAGATTTGSQPRVVEHVASGPTPGSGAGSPGPAIAAGAAVAALAAGAVTIARRRRRPAAP